MLLVLFIAVLLGVAVVASKPLETSNPLSETMKESVATSDSQMNEVDFHSGPF